MKNAKNTFLMLRRLTFPVIAALLFLSDLSAQTDDEPYVVNVNSSGVILDGYDAVSLRAGQARKGQAGLQTTYHGAVYQFSTAENKARFEADPALYEPAFGGFCAYGVATGALVGIDLSTYDTSFQNINIYNYDKAIARKWKKDPAGYYRKAVAQWPKLVAERRKKTHKRQ